MKKLCSLILCGVMSLYSYSASALDINVKETGAVGDGKTMNTEAIQNAIDKCSASGGGTVIVSDGTYLSGSIFLKDNVTLHVDAGAVLAGSGDHTNFKPGNDTYAFIGASKANNIGLSGSGMIFGNGQDYPKQDGAPNRPILVNFAHCTGVTIKDIFLKDSPSWACKLYMCDRVIVDGVRIDNNSGWNNDGIDLSSRNVVVSNCIIFADDDAVCFKSDRADDFMVENIAVTNCVISSNCNFIKFGTGSRVGFRNISISNCTLTRNYTFFYSYWGTPDNPRDWRKIVPGVTNPITGISGIALEVVDGGVMDQISISNITMNGCQTPIFMRLGHRNGEKPGQLKNINISNIVATSESLIANNITGLEDAPVENVILSNMIFKQKAGGTIEDANKPVPEKRDAYPENRMFDNQMLPAYGMYIRHAKGITLDNIVFKLQDGEEYRPAVYAEDVHGMQLRDLQAEPSLGNQPVIRLVDCSNALVSGFFAEKNTPVLLEVKGDKTDNVKLINNDLSLVGKAVDSPDKSLLQKVSVK